MKLDRVIFTGGAGLFVAGVFYIEVWTLIFGLIGMALGLCLFLKGREEGVEMDSWLRGNTWAGPGWYTRRINCACGFWSARYGVRLNRPGRSHDRCRDCDQSVGIEWSLERSAEEVE